MQRLLLTTSGTTGACARQFAVTSQRCFSSAASGNNQRRINTVGVIGLGLMGHGIAQISAQSGFKVVALETEQKALETGTGRIKKSLEKIASKQVEKGKLDQAGAQALVAKAVGNIKPTLNKSDLAECDLIIEAIIENIDIKRNLHAELGKIAKPGAILATNTSSLSVNKIADAAGRASHTVRITTSKIW